MNLLGKYMASVDIDSEEGTYNAYVHQLDKEAKDSAIMAEALVGEGIDVDEFDRLSTQIGSLLARAMELEYRLEQTPEVTHRRNVMQTALYDLYWQIGLLTAQITEPYLHRLAVDYAEDEWVEHEPDAAVNE